jgi:hypothetical protein
VKEFVYIKNIIVVMMEYLHLLVHAVTTVNYNLHDVLRQVMACMYVCI